MNLSIMLAAVTVVATFLGGFLAIKGKDRLHLVLGLSGGLLLGLVAFDLLPEIFEMNTDSFGGIQVVSLALVVGFLSLHFAEKKIKKYLYEPTLPDVDLFLRTSGEQRTSNFLLWQSAYAEMVFMDVLWPDFDRRHLWQAIEIYAKRERRFGDAKPN